MKRIVNSFFEYLFRRENWPCELPPGIADSSETLLEPDHVHLAGLLQLVDFNQPEVRGQGVECAL